MIRPDVMPPPQTPVYWLLVLNNQLIDCASLDKGFAPPLIAVEELMDAEQRYTAQMGEYRGVPVFLMICDGTESLPSDWQWVALRQCLLRSDESLFTLAARACQITGFLRTHKYCGVCGNETSQDREELAVVCGHCGLQSYPRISPCIIVGIYRDDEILLARGVGHPEGMYSVLAGFVESGESFEQTLHREVMEEAGIEVEALEYIGSQPWPFPHSLMAGFIARYKAGTLRLEPTELVDGGWYKLDALPHTPPKGSIAARLISEVKRRAGL
ncbi:MAG: NAD(+) diphosphatase [Idiomarina sp.]|nr:NAD(+) diphosphatase [Idiomarina sp.]